MEFEEHHPSAAAGAECLILRGIIIYLNRDQLPAKSAQACEICGAEASHAFSRIQSLFVTAAAIICQNLSHYYHPSITAKVKELTELTDSPVSASPGRPARGYLPLSTVPSPLPYRYL